MKTAAAAELKRREDRWRPIATSIAGWIDLARDARAKAEDIPRIKEAEKWLKDASADIRNQRFAPIADKDGKGRHQPRKPVTRSSGDGFPLSDGLALTACPP